MKRVCFGVFLFLIAGVCFSPAPAVGGAFQESRGFSFIAVSDPGYSAWRKALAEIRDMRNNPAPKFSPVEFIHVVGDLYPPSKIYADYTDAFAKARKAPVFLPGIGNHEFDDDGAPYRYIRDSLIPRIPNARLKKPGSCDYYWDFRNVRSIIVDAYSELGTRGIINAKGLAWVESVIKSTPPKIDHIFLTFHEPCFPRFRHLNDSFNQDPVKRDAFWNMLLKYQKKVSACFVGHTHTAYRMRVRNPAGKAANDTSAKSGFPDEKGGIYQIDCGAAGNGRENAFVRVQISGKDATFRIFEAPRGGREFKMIDQWKLDRKN